jgi:hypothetical protein
LLHQPAIREQGRTNRDQAAPRSDRLHGFLQDGRAWAARSKLQVHAAQADARRGRTVVGRSASWACSVDMTQSPE